MVLGKDGCEIPIAARYRGKVWLTFRPPHTYRNAIARHKFNARENGQYDAHLCMHAIRYKLIHACYMPEGGHRHKPWEGVKDQNLEKFWEHFVQNQVFWRGFGGTWPGFPCLETASKLGRSTQLYILQVNRQKSTFSIHLVTKRLTQSHKISSVFLTFWRQSQGQELISYFDGHL